MKGLVMVTMLAAAAEPAAPPVAAPPPSSIVLVQPPAPPAPRIVERTGTMPLTTLDVVITSGRETLWRGSVRVGNSGANYSETLRQADEPCPGQAGAADEGYRYVDNSRQLNFSVSRRNGRDGSESFYVNTRWARPLATCEGSGNRGVSLDQQVEIAAGQTVRLSGDAGLVIALTRRAR